MQVYHLHVLKDKEYNKMFNIVDYEVWKNQENSDLMVKVGEYFV